MPEAEKHSLSLEYGLIRCRQKRLEHRLIVRLGKIHGDIGPPDQIVFTASVPGMDGYADTCSYRNRMIVDKIGLGQMTTELLRHLRRVLLVIDCRQQDDELVAAIATGCVRTADAGEQAFRHPSQEFVAGGMPEAVVDAFEPVQIEQQQAHLL